MFTDLCSWNNLYLAYRRASKGKRGQANVAAFELHLEENLLELQSELREKRYQPGKYHSFYIHEPKQRLISAAPFRDRVVHHALCNLIEPVFERSFIFDSYANRVGKGTHRALNRCQQFARRYSYFLQCDIRQFFPSIDHQILADLLARKIEDEDIRWLMNSIIASGKDVLSETYRMEYYPGDDLLAVLRPRGLPTLAPALRACASAGVGNLTSQFWANVYLNPFDHFVQRELGCRAYLRFVDDFILFAPDKVTLWDWKAAIEARLARLRLSIHPGVSPAPVGEGIPFLGFQIYPQKRRLKRRKGLYYQRKLRYMLLDYARGQLSLDELNASVQGWINHIRYANTVGLRKILLKKNVILPRGRIA